MFPGSDTTLPASCLTDDENGFEHESRSSAIYPLKLTTCEERNECFAFGICVVGRGYTPCSLEEFHTPSAERIGGKLLSCYRDGFTGLRILIKFCAYCETHDQWWRRKISTRRGRARSSAENVSDCL